ncbi:MAG: FtsX-like permease family protein, partial [Asgard group archaeon]|nr:FtsX-like permease family protein [Asgard group archaeon]
MVKFLSYPKYALKSIKAKKFRFALGVLATAIAIGVFGVSNVIIDAISTSYLPRIAEETGQIDISITKYNITSSPPIMDYPAIINQIENISEVAGATPRYELQGAQFFGKNKNFTVPILGINPEKEATIDFGNLILNPETEMSDLPMNHCWVRREIAQALELEKGTTYTLNIGLMELNLTYDASFVNDGMLPREYENRVIINIATLEPFIGGSSIATKVVAQFANREDIYDVNRPEETIEKAREIGVTVQEAIGTNYQVALPIASALENRGTGLVFLRLLFTALSVLGVLVCVFLIFSLMSVSVEDKTREFALYRTIGAKKHQIFVLVLVEALLI